MWLSIISIRCAGYSSVPLASAGCFYGKCVVSSTFAPITLSPLGTIAANESVEICRQSTHHDSLAEVEKEEYRSLSID